VLFSRKFVRAAVFGVEAEQVNIDITSAIVVELYFAKNKSNQ
jgi:hypothetical protein